MRINANSFIAVVLAFYALPALAQNMTAKVWSVFTYSIYGDSTPFNVYPSNVLTPYGAHALLAAGSAFRNRYVESQGNLQVQNLSPYSMRPDETSLFSTAENPTVSSAQAFMQGLYPPTDTSYGAPYFESYSHLSNGSYDTYPLHGYQYPMIRTLNPTDYESIIIDGQSQCHAHQAMMHEYNSSPEAQQITQDSEAFYTSLHDRLLGQAFNISSVNYANSRQISEYLEYQAIHNTSLFGDIGLGDIEHARWLADRYTFATNGNLSTKPTPTDAKIRTIAGQTLALQVLSFLNYNVQAHGFGYKMSFLFGNYEPAVALASLMGLASPMTSNFYSRPAHGASLIFELFSYESEEYPSYPNSSDLFVRFLLHNGTDPSTPFTAYPLFGHGPSNIAISLSEFRTEMGNIALNSLQDWCLWCQSPVGFCYSSLNPSQASDTPGPSSMDPGVAGVIGAVVTFVFLAIVAIIGILFFGCPTQPKPNGGFKGNSRMPGDSDVTFQSPNWGDKTIGIHQPETSNIGGIATKAHPRTGSWEMMQHMESNRSTRGQNLPFLGEEHDEWRNHSGLEPVRVRERV